MSTVLVSASKDAAVLPSGGVCEDFVAGDSDELRWYALRVFRNRLAAVVAEVEKGGYESYVPMRSVEKSVFGRTVVVQQPLVASIVFVRATAEYVAALSRDQMVSASVYRRPGSNLPAAISDSEMEVFMLVTRVGVDKVESVDLALAQGDRVRVTDGVFKGAVGCISRVHGAKRLIVSIEGVAAVAVAYIPKDFLEKVQ